MSLLPTHQPTFVDRGSALVYTRDMDCTTSGEPDVKRCKVVLVARSGELVVLMARSGELVVLLANSGDHAISPPSRTSWMIKHR